MVSQINTVHFLFFLLNGTLQDVIRIVPASPFSCGGKCRLVFAQCNAMEMQQPAVIGMEVEGNVVGGSRTSTRAWEMRCSLCRLQVWTCRVRTPRRRQVRLQQLRKLQNGGFLNGIERGTAGKGMTCFKIFFGGLGFEFQLLGSQGLGEAPSPKDMGLARLKSRCRLSIASFLKNKIHLKKKLLQNVNNNSNLNFTLGDRNLDLGCGWIWAHPKALFGPPHPSYKVMTDD